MNHHDQDENNDVRRGMRLDAGLDPRHARDAAIEDALKQAMRAEDPGAAFTQRVLAKAREERAAQPSGRPLHAAAIGQIAAKASGASEVTDVSGVGSEVSDRGSEVSARRAPEVSAQPSRVRTQRLTATRKLVAALAASLTLAAAGAQWMQHRRYVAEGERARAQVLAALRLTNQKLDIVHEQITGREPAR